MSGDNLLTRCAVMLDGRFDHSWECSAHDGNPCDCWLGHLHRIVREEAPTCSCGSIALYAEDPPTLGPHHYASCGRYRDHKGNPALPYPGGTA